MARPKRHLLAQRWDPARVGVVQAAEIFRDWLAERLALGDEEVIGAMLHLPGPVACRCTTACHHTAVELERQRLATEGVRPWR